jgi:three-Cys-motif partner protein
MITKNVKTNLLDHSEAKVKLLGEYLKRYLSIILNDGYTKRIRIYDLFCGEGVYENGGEGSPLVIMKTLKNVYDTNLSRSSRVVPVDCHFNDIDSKKVENVKKIIDERKLHTPNMGKLVFTTEDYQTIINPIKSDLSKFNTEKAFIFIDPYGYKHIRGSDIKGLIENRKTEVLLFLPIQFMYRFDSNGTPDALIEFIDELVGNGTWKEADNVWDYIEQLKVAFRTFLGQYHFVDSFTIKKDCNTVFCLFFFCSHIKAFEKMLEAKWEIDTEQGKGWDYVGDCTGTLFSSQKTNPLSLRLREFLSMEPKTNPQVYEFTLRCGFLPKHTNEIFTDWQCNGFLSVETNNGGNCRKGAFYINYKQYRDCSNPVIFRIKKNG